MAHFSFFRGAVLGWFAHRAGWGRVLIPLLLAAPLFSSCDTLTHRLVGEPRPGTPDIFLLRPIDRIGSRHFWEGGNAATSAQIFDVIRNDAEWQELWSFAVGTPAPGPLPPNTMALAGFLGRRDRPGHALTFVSWELAEDAAGKEILRVVWRERIPPPTAPLPPPLPDLGLGDTTPSPPSPYLIRLLYASPREVVFVPAGP